MATSCIIIGGGIAGPATALALSRIGISCTIYELRDGPSNIGGAINLTPNALRILKELGVEVSGCIVTSIEFWSMSTASKLGEMPFHKTDGHALRMLRKDLQESLLAAVKLAGIAIHYNAKLDSVDEDSTTNKITTIFSNGESTQADFVVGCDGIHSAVRSKFVEPDRIPIYTGAAGVYSTMDLESVKSSVHFNDTALNMSRYGTILTTFVDPPRTKLYLAAVMETNAQSTESWRARGSDRKAVLEEIHRRYDESSIPCITEMVGQLDDKEILLYPIFKLGPVGRWTRGRSVLVGDAAHAVDSPTLIERSGQLIKIRCLLKVRPSDSR